MPRAEHRLRLRLTCRNRNVAPSPNRLRAIPRRFSSTFRYRTGLQDLAPLYADLERALARRDFLCGDLSIADLALFPHLTAVRFLDVSFDGTTHPRLLDWYKRMRSLERSSCRPRTDPWVPGRLCGGAAEARTDRVARRSYRMDARARLSRMVRARDPRRPHRLAATLRRLRSGAVNRATKIRPARVCAPSSEVGSRGCFEEDDSRR